VMLTVLTLPDAAPAAVAPVWHEPAVRGFFAATLGVVALGPRQLAVALVLLGWLGACLPGRRLARDEAARFALGVATALAAATLLMPNAGLGGGYANERLPWLIPLVLAPALRPPGAGPLGRFAAGHGVLLAALAGASLAVTAGYAVPLAQDVARSRDALAADLEPGAAVLLARYAPRPLWPLHDPLLHAASRYGELGLVDAGYAPEDVAYFPVRLLPGALSRVDPDAAYRAPRGIDWATADGPDVLLAWGASDADQADLARGYARDWSAPGHPLTVWRRLSGLRGGLGGRGRPRAVAMPPGSSLAAWRPPPGRPIVAARAGHAATRGIREPGAPPPRRAPWTPSPCSRPRSTPRTAGTAAPSPT